jgi:hypothetical protein
LAQGFGAMSARRELLIPRRAFVCANNLLRSLNLRYDLRLKDFRLDDYKQIQPRPRLFEVTG